MLNNCVHWNILDISSELITSCHRLVNFHISSIPTFSFQCGAWTPARTLTYTRSISLALSISLVCELSPCILGMSLEFVDFGVDVWFVSESVVRAHPFTVCRCQRALENVIWGRNFHHPIMLSGFTVWYLWWGIIAPGARLSLYHWIAFHRFFFVGPWITWWMG